MQQAATYSQCYRKPTPRGFSLTRRSAMWLLKQLGGFGRRLHYLSQGRPETSRRSRRVIESVVVEDHVHLFGFLRYLLTSLRHFVDLLGAIIIIETSGNGLAGEISVGIAAVQTEISRFRRGNRIDLRRNNREVFLRGCVHVNERDLISLQKIQGRGQMFRCHPVSVS